MRNILYVVAVILLICWVFSFFVFSFKGQGLIHILLVLAIISLLLGLIRGRG